MVQEVAGSNPVTHPSTGVAPAAARDVEERAMSDDLGVTRSVSEGIARFTINRPEAGGALNHAMRDQLAAWFHDASADLHIRVIVLASNGTKGFCTGADLRSIPADSRPKPEGAPDKVVFDNARVIRDGWQRLVTSVLDCEKPVIGQVQAVAAGGGLHLALACDLVVAGESASFVEAFIRRGIAPDAAGAWILPRLIGIQKAKELCFFGDSVSASDAERMGLINRVVPDGDLDATVDALARRLAVAPTKAITVTKALLNRSLDVDRTTSLYEEAHGQEMVTMTEDMREGIAAFVERRDPAFKGW